MQITIITSERPSILSKQIQRTPHGELTKTSSAHMTAGNATRVSVAHMLDLNHILDGLHPSQAIAYGVPDADFVRLTYSKALSDNPGAITRSDKYFHWPDGDGVMMFDYDPEDGAPALSQNDLLGRLFATFPGLTTSSWLWRPSASGHIFDSQTGAELVGLKGQRVYLHVADASDIPRAGAVAFKRLWLAGHGRVELAQNGAMLTRGLIDPSVWQPSRLDFAARAVCGPGLEQRAPSGVPVPGDIIDTRRVFPDLSDEEEREYKQRVIDAKSAATGRSHQRREEFVLGVAQAEGTDPNEVRARYELAENRRVLGLDFPVELAYEEGAVTVADILADPTRFHGKICLDPIEPDYNNRHPVGKIFNDEKGAFIDSKAHGGRVFKLGSVSALAFQRAASDGRAYEDLMGQIREHGCDLSQTPELLRQIADGPFCDDELVFLRAELKGELREARRLSKDVERLIDGSAPGTTMSPAPPPAAYTGGGIAPLDKPLNPDLWRPGHTSGKDRKPKGTVENFEVMAAAYGVYISFDVIAKELEVVIPGEHCDAITRDEAAVARLESLARLNDMPVPAVAGGIAHIACRNERNPVAEWVMSAPWDGADHIGHLWSQIVLEDDEDERLCEAMFRTWMRCAIAAPARLANTCEYVLVFIDEKGGAGKTRFFRTLCPPKLRKDSLMLDVRDKDSWKKAISAWLVELGELDGTFSRSEANALKAFLSGTEDEIRLPYGKKSLKYPRMTAYIGSVNERQFLVDLSENRRFWGISVKGLNHMHTVSVQQAWAQAYAEVMAGAPLVLSPEDDAAMRQRNRDRHAVTDPIYEMLEMILQDTDPNSEDLVHMNCTSILKKAGLFGPTKRDVNTAARWLRGRGFQETKKNGMRGFWVPNLSASAAAFATDLRAVK